MRRIAALLAMLLLLIPSAYADHTPQAIREATSVEEAAQFVLLPPEDDLAEVKAGYVRYIAQRKSRDSAFRKGYWLGGEEGSELDLTVRRRNGIDYVFYADVMCTRAVYSMALSCLGIDMSPGAMSELVRTRNLYEPYDIITYKLGLEHYSNKTTTFNTMVENYLSDESYSPVYLYISKPNGSLHALLIVGIIPETGRFIVVDPNPYHVDGKPVRVYFISLNKQRSEIINSSFKRELKGSTVLQVHQWRLPPSETEAE